MSISDRLDETAERAARVIGSVMSRWDMDGRPDVDGGIDTLIARALAEAGLIAPAPLREEWAVSVAWRPRSGTYIHQKGTGATPEHALADASPGNADDFTEASRTTLRRMVTDWEDS